MTFKTQKDQQIQQKGFEEELAKIPINITERDSQATRRRIIFKVYKKLLGRKQALADFQEPCLLLMRNSTKDEWYENATGGKFNYKHSDGEERFILLDPRFLRSIEYAGKTFKAYVCHEDIPTPLPENPTVTAELMAIMYEKVLNDIKKWKVEEAKAKALQLKGWATILLVAGRIFLLYIILKPSGTTPALNETINQTVNATINATKTAVTVLTP